MTINRGVEYLEEALGEAIDYCRKEFSLNYAEVIGVLQIVSHTMFLEAIDDEEDEEEWDEEQA